MNIFNGVLTIESVSSVIDKPTQWDIVCTFADYSGFFYASDALVGDIIYNDGSSLNMGLLRYSIVEINPLTNYTYLYARVEWSLPSLLDLAEPLAGFETVIGRQLLGGVFLPSPSVQPIGDNFIAYARNLEAWLAARYNYMNRSYDVAYVGEKNNLNVIFTPVENFILETLSVKFNGIELKHGIDYNVIGNDIILEIPPVEEDNLVIDFNRS